TPTRRPTSDTSGRAPHGRSRRSAPPDAARRVQSTFSEKGFPVRLRRLRPQLQFLYRALGAFTTVVNVIAVLAVIAALVAPETTWSRAVVAVAALIATGRVLHLVRDDAAATERRTLVGNSVIGRLAVTVGAAIVAIPHVEQP